MSVEFDTPANRIISQFAPKNKFRIDTTLPDLAFLRQLSIQGRLFQEQGSHASASTSDLITLTPAAGETLFIYDMFLTSTGDTTFTVLNKDISKTFRPNGVAGSVGVYNAQFFDSIVGDGTSTFKISVDATAGVRVATILAWRENTSRIREPAI